MGQLFNSIIENQFILNAIIAIFLSGFAAGITGTFVVVKKISYVGGGIAHAVMGGLGIAYFMNFNPMWGALAFAIIAALVIGYLKIKYKQTEDTLISALWAIGMAIGIIFAYTTPGYNVDLLSFLFGNILLISTETLWMLAILDIVIMSIILIYFRQIVYVCFDEEYSLLRGINVEFIYILLLSMIALTVVILVQTVGIVLAIALLTLPSAISKMYFHSIAKIIIVSVILIMVFNYSGLLVSFILNFPAGATIILVTGIAYVISLIVYQKKNG